MNAEDVKVGMIVEYIGEHSLTVEPGALAILLDDEPDHLTLYDVLVLDGERSSQIAAWLAKSISRVEE